MAFQFAGASTVFTTFTATTRRQLVDNISAQLQLSGWTVISGGGTADVLLQSVTTPAPANLDMRIRLTDPGSNNCAQITVYNTSQIRSSQVFYLFPQAAKTWRIHTNGYQLFVWSSVASVYGREFFACGVPYLPSFLQNGVIWEAIWAQGNCTSDSDSGIRQSFKTNFFVGMESNVGYTWNTLNGIPWSHRWDFYTSYVGQQGILTQRPGYVNNNEVQFHDLSLLVYEPLIGWGWMDTYAEWKLRGQLWDMAIVAYGFTENTVYTFESKNWISLNDVHWGGGSSSEDRASMMLYTP